MFILEIDIARFLEKNLSFDGALPRILDNKKIECKNKTAEIDIYILFLQIRSAYIVILLSEKQKSKQTAQCRWNFFLLFLLAAFPAY